MIVYGKDDPINCPRETCGKPHVVVANDYLFCPSCRRLVGEVIKKEGTHITAVAIRH